MRTFLLSWLLSFSFLYSPEQVGAEAHQIRGFTQGTSYQITYYAKTKVIAKQEIEQILGSVDSSLSVYKPYSLISRFNSSVTKLKVDTHLEKVVKKSLEISEETEGAFDITVYPLMQAWGFGTHKVSALPDSTTIDSLLEHVGPGTIRLTKNYLVKNSPNIQIDVNGIAQGYTVDVLAEFLEEKGIRNYIVEIGGEIRVKGKKPGGAKMAIGIEGLPESDGTSPSPIQNIIRLSSGAVTTSGNYRRYVQMDNQKFSHLLNPKTGYPIQNELISVTVWAKDAITADGYDNALMYMGLEKGLKFVKQHNGLEAYFIYQRQNGVVADTATAGFYKLMD